MAPAPGSFHVLVAKNLKILRLTISKTSQFLSSKVPIAARPAASAEPVYAHIASRQPIHPAAFLKQSKRWLSSTTGYDTASVRRFGTTSGKAPFSAGAKYNRTSFPVSRVGTAVNQFTGRSPFASTLRPNLTGGTLGRTAGGYTTGAGRIGGARYFSHGPTAQAQVISNVSQAVRAFCLNGQRAMYDGVDARTGKSRFRAVSALQEKAVNKMEGVPKASPGSYIDFCVNPTITALTPLNAVTGFKKSSRKEVDTLNTEGLLDILSIDFSRSLKELAVILNDLKRLSSIGDLPITYQNSSLRIHFPGCDAQTIEKLSLELDLQRGRIGQDPDFDAFAGTEIALLFPFAPSKTVSECSFYEKPVQGRQINRHDLDPYSVFVRERDPILFSERGSEGTEEFSTCSDDGLEGDIVDVQAEVANPWADAASPSGYESLRSSELESSAGRVVAEEEKSYATPLEYQGIEGIYRFMELCDRAGR